MIQEVPQEQEQKSQTMELISNSSQSEDHWTLRSEEFLPESYRMIQQIEEQILGFHGIEVGKDILIKNVRINLCGTDEDWIHTYVSKEKQKEKQKHNKPILVLIHGYGGGSILFLKMIKILSKTFQVYCFDIIGLSISSRPKVEHLQTIEDILNFFVTSIEEWVKEVGLQDDSFFLAGHSFGGYLASFYCKRNQSCVKKLILISPAGVSKISKQENELFVSKRYPHYGLKDKLIHWVRKYVWKHEITYEWLYSIQFLPRKTIMAHMISSRLKANSYREKQLWQSFFSLVLSLPESTSKFVFKLFFYPRVVAHLPAEDAFSEGMTVKVHFIYGQQDWMNREGAHRLIQLNNDIFSEDIISDSGHHINIDNPEELAQKIELFALK